MPFNARVVVNASLQLYTTSTTSNVFCRAKIAPLGGSYNVQGACCYNGNLGPAVNFDKGDLTAVAIAR